MSARKPKFTSGEDMAKTAKSQAATKGKKYELLADDIIDLGANHKLYRIRALVAIAAMGVAVGDLGGYVETEANLAQVSDNAWVSGNARVYGNARVERHYPIAIRSDGYTFIYVPTKGDGEPVVIAGCQYRTIVDYRAHTNDYSDPRKKAETLLILRFLEEQAALERWS